MPEQKDAAKTEKDAKNDAMQKTMPGKQYIDGRSQLC